MSIKIYKQSAKFIRETWRSFQNFYIRDEKKIAIDLIENHDAPRG